MPTAEQHQFFTNFTKGLNTEATPLNFPENTAQELDNFDLFRTGEIKRRLGLDFEDAYTVRPETTPAADADTAAMSLHEWKAVNGKGDVNFLVVQVGTKLFFHDLGAEPVSGTLRGSIDLASFKTGPAPENKVYTSAFGEGIMIVCNSEQDPAIIEFDEDTEEFSATAVKMEIRDFEGIDEDTEADLQPTNLTPDHKYNLRNQGWPKRTTVNDALKGNKGVTQGQDPITWTKNKIGVYPSNADLFWAARATAAEDPEVIGKFSPWELDGNFYGNTPAPTGHHILELFSQDRGSVSGIGGLTTSPQTTDRRPSVTAFYAGRIWYAGVPDKNYTGDVFFSQQLTDISKAGKCYQNQDPTAEDLNSLLATDGGVIHIADMGEVLWAGQVGQDLILVSATGVYAISGTSGANFNAEDFTVRKVVDEGAIGKESVVEAENTLFWWGEGGIWNMSGSQITEELSINRISKDTIQTLYEGISPASRAYTRGFYDDFSKKIYWLYNDTGGYDAINFRFRYNRALVLDLTLGGFYELTFSDLATDTPWVAGMTQKSPGNQSIVEYDIFQGLDDVVEAADDIVQDVAFEVFADVKLKLLTFVVNEDGSYSYTFSEFKDRDFVDWATWDVVKHGALSTGANYVSTLQAGWNDFGDPIRTKFISHLTSFFNVTEDGFELDADSNVIHSNQSGAFLQTRWEYTDLDVGKWTKLQQVYRLFRAYIPLDETDPFDYGYTVVRTKTRVRGQGHAFSVRYESEAGKDLQLIGFAVNVRAPTKV